MLQGYFKKKGKGEKSGVLSVVEELSRVINTFVLYSSCL